MKLIPTILILFFCFSCNKMINNSESIIQNNSKQKVSKNTFVFLSYNDDGDYFILNAKKDNKWYSFINDDIDDRSLLKGDICEISWIQDTIYIAGDGETPELADRITLIKKIKNGKVSQFRKEYSKELKYHYFDENYSQDYLNKIYLIVENYIANSKNEMIKLAINNKDQIEYSIEEKTENNKTYDVLGIGITFEHRFNILQWIYIYRDTNIMYEYDIANEKLIPFE